MRGKNVTESKMAASCWSSSAARCGLKLMFRQNQNQASHVSAVHLCRQCLIVVSVCGSFPLNYLIILNPFKRLHLQSDPTWRLCHAALKSLTSQCWLSELRHKAANWLSVHAVWPVTVCDEVTAVLSVVSSRGADMSSPARLWLLHVFSPGSIWSHRLNLLNEWCLSNCRRMENRTQEVVLSCTLSVWFLHSGLL